MKPRMYLGSSGLWYCYTIESMAVNECPFVAYIRWMEYSLKTGEQ